MKTSQTGIDLIVKSEGFRARAYRDAVGKWTIGYGHLIRAGELFKTAISRKKGEDLLQRDVRFAENAVTKLVKVKLNQNQFDSLVSFVFNLGTINFSQSTLLRKLNAGDYTGAANQFGRWIYGKVDGKSTVLPGLVTRRKRERDLFLS